MTKTRAEQIAERDDIRIVWTSVPEWELSAQIFKDGAFRDMRPGELKPPIIMSILDALILLVDPEYLGELMECLQDRHAEMEDAGGPLDRNKVT